MRTFTPSVMPFRQKLLEDLRWRDTRAAEERMREHLLKLQKIYLAASRRTARAG